MIARCVRLGGGRWCPRGILRLQRYSTAIKGVRKADWEKSEDEIEYSRENLHFYNVLAQREKYVVGKVVSDAMLVLKTRTEASCLYEFLNETDCDSLVDLNPNLVYELAELVPRLKKEFVYELMLHTAHFKDFTQPCYKGAPLQKLRFSLQTYSLTSLREQALSLEDQWILADLWHRNGFNRIHPYVVAMLRAQSLHFDRLQPEDILQHIFFANTVRTLHLDVARHIEAKLQDIIPTLDVEETALVCQSLFKCKVNFYNKNNFERIVDRLEQAAGAGEPVGDYTIVAFAKFLHGYGETGQSLRIGAISRFVNILPRFQESWSIGTYYRLADVGSQVRICNESVVKNALEAALVQLDSARSKHVAGILALHALFNMSLSEDKAKRLIRYFLHETEKYRRRYMTVRATWALALSGYFDKDLYTRSFEKDESWGKEKFFFDLYSIWHTYMIEAPEIHKLVPLDSKTIAGMEVHFRLERSHPRPQARLAKQVCDIVKDRLRLNASLESFFPMYVSYDVKVEPNIVLVCHSPSNLYNGQHLMGYAAHRVRLLKAKGFHVIELPFEMHVSGLNLTQRTEYIRKALEPALGSTKTHGAQKLLDFLA